MTAKVFSNDVLGNDGQSLRSLDMMIGTLNNFGGSVKEVLVLEFSYLFRSGEEADYVLNGPIGKTLKDKMEESGIMMTAYLELGFRHFPHAQGKADSDGGRLQPSVEKDG